MASFQAPPRCLRFGVLLLAGTLAALLAVPGLGVNGLRAKEDVLHIGTSGSLLSGRAPAKEKAALETLRLFIKDETGMANEILKQKDWDELASKLSKKELQVGVFQGYEFAWAKEKYPELRALAIAINVYRYPEAYIVTNRDNKAKDFAGLQGQSLTIPDVGEHFLNLFVDRQCDKAGKKPGAFFSKVITNQDNVETALDDTVDGVVNAAAVDKAGLESFKRRKPARFAKLKMVAHSEPLPPAVVAYYDKNLDEATLARFRKGLLGASQKEKGQMILTLFHLTGFESLPGDFDKVLARTRKEYPPETLVSTKPR